MEEYNVTEVDTETESSENDTEALESFSGTVSGNDTGADTGTDGQEEIFPEDSGDDGGQDELYEMLGTLVEVLTPNEEDAETENETSFSETVTLELLEKIYAEIAAVRTSNDLYHEAWVRSQQQVQTATERSGTLDIYTIVLLVGIFFLCAAISGLKLAGMIWGRFL